MSAARVIFHGKVQGVFFRANTKKKADELGLSGWVRNLPEGTVEAMFIGPKDDVKKVIDWCRTSQPYAIVSDVLVDWTDGFSPASGFEIRY